MQVLLMLVWLMSIGALIIAVSERESKKPNGWVTTFSFIGIALLFYLGGHTIYTMF